MLPFWKKTGNKNKSPLSSPGRQVNGSVESPVDGFANREPCCLGPLSNFVCDVKDYKPIGNKSRLSLTFLEALHDKLALSYFSQYLEARNYVSLLNVLLDLEQLLKTTVSILNCDENQTLVKNENNTKTFVIRARSNDVVFEGSTGSDNRTVRPRIRCASESNERLSSVTWIKIWQRYLADDAPEHIRVPEEIRSRIQACLTHHDSSEWVFQKLHEHVFQTVEKDLWNDFVRSEWHCKYQVKVLTNGTVTLADILYHNSALSSFIEFLEQEGCQQIIEFWLAATNFESHFSQNTNTDPLQAQNDAIVIYDKYLSLQATCPLGVDDATRCEVEQGICVESSRPNPDCFQPALRVALTYLHINWLRPFTSSQYYVHLLSDLMRSSRATSSPASSVTDVSIDTSVKHDPDSIWRRRRQHSGLSIGRIDQLGRFETDIEPEPDRKSESRITRVVKKLVNKDEGKAQQEMAWQVAEMIVRNITNVTMGGGNSQSDDDDDNT
ncbi:A-kinase anchoring protein pkaap [Lycorma delicatula]|uniref:A-kinase anchoring protein pkaap n=1 Tax=Lycorma delicatula TaxID=130591 RepID=UPI003F51012C